MTTPDITPAAGPGPACSLCGISASPTVWLGHWRRRLTPAEVAAEQAREQARRDELVTLADPQLPPPEFGPLPDCADWTTAVFGCIDHALQPGAAALIHQAACTAPTVADLPGCNCTPEPAPVPEPDPEPAPMPPGW